MSDNFSNIDEYIDTLSQELQPTAPAKDYDKPLYKKWFRSKVQTGFLSITPWHQALKMKIDIGKTSSEGKLLSSTNVFVDAVDLGAYLKSVVSMTAPSIYPANEKTGAPTAESFVSYGGAMIDGKPVSRIFKIHYWQSGEDYDSSAFAWKCGHFAARKSDSGAFIPDMKSPLSVDSIKVTRQEVASISYLVDLSMISYVATKSDWHHL